MSNRPSFSILMMDCRGCGRPCASFVPFHINNSHGTLLALIRPPLPPPKGKLRYKVENQTNQMPFTWHSWTQNKDSLLEKWDELTTLYKASLHNVHADLQ